MKTPAPATAAFCVILCSRLAFAEATVSAQDELSQIVVTAQKREETARSIPMSIVAISAASIDDASPEGFHELLLSVPGLSYSASEVALARYSIRGVSTAAANPTVGIYLDDLSLATMNSSFAGAIDPQLFDLDRIEVLEGPQGTLYGGNAMGGAIKYVTKKPLLDSVSISAATSVGSVEHGGISYGVESTFNFPLVPEHLAMRIGASYRWDAGYINNIAGGSTQDWSRSADASNLPFRPLEYNSLSQFSASDFNGRSTTVSRASLEFVPIESLSIRPSVTVQRSDQANPDEFFTNLPNFESADRFAQPTRDRLNIFSLEIAAQADRFTLTSLTGEVDRRLTLERDFSLNLGALIPAIFADDSHNDSVTSTKTLSEEIRVSSPEHAPVRWILGLYYSHQKTDFRQQINTVGSGAFFGTETDLTYFGDQRTDAEQKAVFADLNYPIGHWNIGMGTRYFHTNQRVDSLTGGVLNGGTNIVAGRTSIDTGSTPRVSISYTLPNTDHLLYASAGKGFRPGGPNLYDSTSPLCSADLERLGLTRLPQSYQSDGLWTYELGSKSLFSEGHAQVNAAAFYTNWTRIQQQVTLPTCAFPFTGNVGAALIKGAELSLEIRPLEKLTIAASLAYVDSRVTESATGVPAQVGQELLDTPRWSGSIGARYRVALGPSTTGALHLDFGYHGANLREFASVAPVTYANGVMGVIADATQVQQAYRVVNLGLEVQHNQISYRLYVDNLLDSAPYLDFRRPPGFSAADTLRPRTIGLSGRASY